jgi:Outer membrane protein beta-barrel domain
VNPQTCIVARGMLGSGRMKCAHLVVAGVMAISPLASAGTYLGLAVGTEPGINSEFTTASATPIGRSLRGLAGIRFGNVSLEGALNGFDVTAGGFGNHTAYQLSAAAKLSLPLGNNFEGFGRFGLERTWLNLDSDRYDYQGDGFVVGAGFEFRLDAIVANASLFVDYNIHSATLEATSGKVQETSRIWALGFTVGL